MCARSVPPPAIELSYEAKLARARAEHLQAIQLPTMPKLSAMNQCSIPELQPGSARGGLASNVTARRLARASSRAQAGWAPAAASPKPTSVTTHFFSVRGGSSFAPAAASPRRPADAAGAARQILTQKGALTGLERLLAVGEYCEQVRSTCELDFFGLTREFVMGRVWDEDGSCVDLDVPELFTLVERWTDAELLGSVQVRGAVLFASPPRTRTQPDLAYVHAHVHSTSRTRRRCRAGVHR